METPEQARVESERGAVAAQISREIVQLHATMFGRGPTKAKTYVDDEYVLCVLEDIYTPAERTLIKADKVEEVVSARHAFQEAVEEDFTAIVTGATGRPVRAFMSQVKVEPELAAELFLMEPISGDGADPIAGDGDGGDPITA